MTGKDYSAVADLEVAEEIIRTLLLNCDAYNRRATAAYVAERFGFDVADLTEVK